RCARSGSTNTSPRTRLAAGSSMNTITCFWRAYRLMVLIWRRILRRSRGRVGWPWRIWSRRCATIRPISPLGCEVRSIWCLITLNTASLVWPSRFSRKVASDEQARPPDGPDCGGRVRLVPSQVECLDPSRRGAALIDEVGAQAGTADADGGARQG